MSGAASFRVYRVLMLAGAAMLAACAVGPDFVRPPLPDAESYTREPQPPATVEANGKAQHFVAGADLPVNWWHLFNSATLDAVVQEALANNPTLEAAEANLRQSQARLRAGDGVFYPSVDFGINGDRLHTAPIQQGSSGTGSVFDVVTSTLVVSYTFDVFGGERRTVEGLAAQVDDQRYLGKAAYVALSSNVVNACIARAAYLAQARATEQLIELESEQMLSIEAQARVGTVPYSNVLSQRGLLASNQALLAALRLKIDQNEHLLALLEGLLPSQMNLPAIELDDLALPTDLPLGVPSELVRRRPDILSAESQLHAASANIGVATAAMFPSLTLNATYGVAGGDLGKLLSGGETFWTVAPALAAPLFRGGSLRAERQAAIEAYSAEQQHYRQTVLVAFGQVADALKALEHDAEILRAQAEAKDTSAEALFLVRANEKAGLVAYVDLLTADVLYHQAVIGYLQAVAQRQQDTVALFAALGGGWWAP